MGEDQDDSATIGTELAAPPPVVGPYRIVRRLAAGGFGTVYAAERVARGEPAALKIMHPELAAHAEAVVRFEREIEAMRRVRHPNVAEVHEGGRLPDGRPWFAMELLSGVSLSDHLAARGRLPAREALEILAPLCDALAAAHALRIVHRDVKPSNVFLADDDARRVVLLDFGVAKLLDAEGPGLTTSRQVIGSISCMAPEQILGKQVDARTDVYALGGLAYRMLTGEPPFAGRTAMALQQMHLYASPRPPSLLAPVDPALNEPILRALGKDPAARQASVAAFHAEVAAAAGDARAGAARGGIAVLVEAYADPEALVEPDDRLLDELESALPAAVEALEAAGMQVSMETGTSVLLGAARPGGAGEDARRRAEVIEAALSLWRRLSGRPGRDPRVEIRIRVHVGAAELSPDGAMTGGELLRLGAWVPEIPAEGVLASGPAIEGLGLPAGAVFERGGLGWVEILREG